MTRRQETASEDTAVRQVLLNAGWYPGRQQEERTDAWVRRLDGKGFEMSQAARDALSEFGGLEVSARGPGIDFARGSFRLDPALALGEEDRFARHPAAPESRLYPLGEAYDGNAFLAIDQQGWVYLLMDEVSWIAPSMIEALRCLLLGKRPSAPADSSHPRG